MVKRTNLFPKVSVSFIVTADKDKIENDEIVKLQK